MRTAGILGICCWLAAVFSTFGSRAANVSDRSSQGHVEIDYAVQQDFSLHEPIVVSFSVHNGLSRPIKLTLGAQGKQFFKLSLTTPDGRVFESDRRAGSTVSVVTFDGEGEKVLAPGENYHQPLLINQWFAFDAPGQYLLTSQLSTSIEVSGDGTLPPQTQSTRFRVSPRDPARLEKVCSELIKHVENATNVEAEREPALALSYINDPIAVPYLAQMLSHHRLNYRLAIAGLERIGNDAAIEVLLTTMNDTYGDMGDLSRQALTRVQDRIPNANLKETVRRALGSKRSD